MSRDFYKILGVNQSATSVEIKKAYRKKAMKYHPDRNPNDKQAEELFKEAAEAYEVLGEDGKRRIYDQYGEEGLQSSGYSGPRSYEDIFSSFSDIFEDLFGFSTSQRRQQGPAKGSDLRYDITISFMEGAHGVDKEIEYMRPETCWTCEGSGCRPGYKPEACSTCDGKGQVIHSQGFFRVSTACPHCRGTGEKISEPCVDCDGHGLVEKKKKLALKIPAGVDSGARMRVSGEGESGRKGGPAGDLYVFIQVEPHEYFQREGNIIFLKYPLSMSQASIGCEVDIPTINGEKKLTIPEGTQPGRRFVLKSEGIPSLRGGQVGDMVVEVDVQTPIKLTSRQHELLQEFDQIEKEKADKDDSGFFKKLFNMAS